MRRLASLIAATFFGAAGAQAQSLSTLGAAELRATRAVTVDATAVPVPTVRSTVSVDPVPTVRAVTEPATRIRVGDMVPTPRLAPATGVTRIERESTKTVIESRVGRKATPDGERKGAKAAEDKAGASPSEAAAATAGSEAPPAVARRLPAC